LLIMNANSKLGPKCQFSEAYVTENQYRVQAMQSTETKFYRFLLIIIFTKFKMS
jgi:hypothetical protein